MKIRLLLFLILFLTFNHAHGEGLSDTALIKSYLETIARNYPSRSYNNVTKMDETADYIRSVFAQFSDSVTMQRYQVNGYSYYENVICSFGPANARRIIIGAHYDVFTSPGADDGASGIVGLFELARLLQCQELKYRVDLVAYTLGEEPFLKSPDMGSFVHAKMLYNHGVKVYGMVSLDMIGYFNSQPHTQKYPVDIFSLIFGTRANFIALVKKPAAGPFARHFCTVFKAESFVKTHKISAPPSMLDMIWHDHMNYWKFGYSALMITDTQNFRDPYYHNSSDTVDTIDINTMSKVIDAVFTTLMLL